MSSPLIPHVKAARDRVDGVITSTGLPVSDALLELVSDTVKSVQDALSPSVEDTELLTQAFGDIEWEWVGNTPTTATPVFSAMDFRRCLTRILVSLGWDPNNPAAPPPPPPAAGAPRPTPPSSDVDDLTAAFTSKVTVSSTPPPPPPPPPPAATPFGPPVHADDMLWDVEPIPDDYPPLRDYQASIVAKATRLMRRFHDKKSSRRPSALVYLPTGGGKTRIACELTHWCISRRLPVVFLVNRNKLASQAQSAMHAHGLGLVTGVLKAGFRSRSACPVQVTSIQSLRSGARTWPRAKLLIVDEAHCAASSSYKELCRTYAEDGAFVLGLTATPVRLDPSESLSAVFHTLLEGPSVADLIRAGVLVPPRVVAIDNSAVRQYMRRRHRTTKQAKPRGGRRQHHAGFGVGVVSHQIQMKEAELARLFAAKTMVDAVVAAWTRRCVGRRSVAFCINIEHSRALEAAFGAAGVTAVHVDGTTPEKQRRGVFAGLSSGSVDVVTSVNVLSEGFDEPRVECVMLLRPTESRGLYLQQVGRGLRCAAGKTDCIVLDQSGNTVLHGPVTAPADYSFGFGGRTDTVVGGAGAGAGAGLRATVSSVRRCADCGSLSLGVGCAECARGEDGKLSPGGRDTASVRPTSKGKASPPAIPRMRKPLVASPVIPRVVVRRDPAPASPPAIPRMSRSKKPCAAPKLETSKSMPSAADVATNGNTHRSGFKPGKPKSRGVKAPLRDRTNHHT